MSRPSHPRCWSHRKPSAGASRGIGRKRLLSRTATQTSSEHGVVRHEAAATCCGYMSRVHTCTSIRRITRWCFASTRIADSSTRPDPTAPAYGSRLHSGLNARLPPPRQYDAVCGDGYRHRATAKVKVPLRYVEFLDYLRLIDKEVTADLDVRLVLNSYHSHCTPTYSSWWSTWNAGSDCSVRRC